MFINSGVIVSTRNRQDEWTGKQDIEVRYAEKNAPFATVPMAVLVNGESASASEIFAACMQDHGRAVVIGSRSYGKGSVQKMFPMEGGESILKLTTASYWRPSGKNIHRVKAAKETDEWGVRPDPGYDLPLTEQDETKRREARSERDAFRPGADAEPAPPLDPQLAKAVEYLEAKLRKEDSKK
jgi:carboxyl-terminal processing protease